MSAAINKNQPFAKTWGFTQNINENKSASKYAGNINI